MGKKNSIYVIKIHTNRDQTLNIYTKRPASPTCNLYGSLPRRRGEGAERGGGGEGGGGEGKFFAVTFLPL